MPPAIEMLGKIFGHLTVTKEALAHEFKSGKSERRFICSCDCGGTLNVLMGSLRSGATSSCGCMPFGKLPSPMVGKRFGKLLVIREVEPKRHPSGSISRSLLCRCECGTKLIVISGSLRSGKTVSCGCAKIARVTELNLSHGETRSRNTTPEYRAWSGMKMRCTNHRCKRYKDYGGRGIRVCERWFNSFESFLADMGRKPSPKHSLDRFPDNDGNYEPGNCRWATASQQNKNQRRSVKPS